MSLSPTSSNNSCSAAWKTTRPGVRPLNIYWNIPSSRCGLIVSGRERGRGDEGVTPNVIDFFDDKTKIEVAKESSGDGLLLDSIWRSLLPGEGKVMSKSKLWTSVGFQGINPATDIRGGGRLSVLCLEHFAAHYSDAYVHGCLRMC